MPSTDLPPPSEIHRFIRKISIVILLPAAPILIAGGICAKTTLIAAVWAHVFSSVFGTYFLVNANNEKSVPANLAVFLDTCIGLLYLGLLIPVWIEPVSSYYHGWTEIMLATYGTCFMIINMVIHFYFAAYVTFTKFVQICWAHECPVCRAGCAEEQGALLPTTATTATATTATTTSKGSHYTLLKDDIEDAATPRTSEDHV